MIAPPATNPEGKNPFQLRIGGRLRRSDYNLMYFALRGKDLGSLLLRLLLFASA